MESLHYHYVNHRWWLIVENDINNGVTQRNLPAQCWHSITGVRDKYVPTFCQTTACWCNVAGSCLIESTPATPSGSSMDEYISCKIYNRLSFMIYMYALTTFWSLVLDTQNTQNCSSYNISKHFSEYSWDIPLNIFTPISQIDLQSQTIGQIPWKIARKQFQPFRWIWAQQQY